MHIAIFADSYLPYKSGVVRSIVTFTKELRALGNQVSIFAPNYGDNVREKDVYRFRSLRAPTFKDFALAVPFAPSLPDKLRQLSIDVIHVHSPFMMGRLGARAAHRLGIPLVFTYHTLYEEYIHYFPIAPSLAKQLVRNYTLSFCNNCSLVITPTDVIANYIKAGGVNVSVTSIPTGIQIEHFKDLDSGWLRRHLKIRGEDIILIYVGRLGKEKNIHFLLNAFALIHKKVPNTHLVLVGSGPLKETLQHEARLLGIHQSLTFAGSFPFEQMPVVYAGADIFVFASTTETQGLVIAEAKAAGLPVVAVDAYGVKEMVNHGEDGFLSPEDLPVFSEKVVKIVHDQELRNKMSLKARHNAALLSSRAMAQELQEQYRSLIKRSVN